MLAVPGHLTKAEGAAGDAHVYVDAHEDDVLDAAGFEQVPNLDAGVANGVFILVDAQDVEQSRGAALLGQHRPRQLRIGKERGGLEPCPRDQPPHVHVAEEVQRLAQPRHLGQHQVLEYQEGGEHGHPAAQGPGKEHLELWIRAKIEAGGSVHDYYPPTPDKEEEYTGETGRVVKH